MLLYTFEVDRDRVRVHGIDFSGTVRVVLEVGDWQLWRISAGTVWSGIALPRTYVPVRYRVIQVIERRDGYLVGRLITHRTPGAHWKRVVRELEASVRAAAATGKWCEVSETKGEQEWERMSHDNASD